MSAQTIDASVILAIDIRRKGSPDSSVNAPIARKEPVSFAPITEREYFINKFKYLTGVFDDFVCLKGHCGLNMMLYQLQAESLINCLDF